MPQCRLYREGPFPVGGARPGPLDLDLGAAVAGEHVTLQPGPRSAAHQRPDRLVVPRGRCLSLRFAESAKKYMQSHTCGSFIKKGLWHFSKKGCLVKLTLRRKVSNHDLEDLRSHTDSNDSKTGLILCASNRRTNRDTHGYNLLAKVGGWVP